MPNKNHTLMSLAEERNTSKVGWHTLTGPYDDGYIEKIKDPSNAALQRVLTAIPSPFARVHLFDAAFGFVNRLVNGERQHDGTSEFHHMVSDCLDVIELLYRGEDQALGVTFQRWTVEHNLASSLASSEPGQKLLAETLKLYLSEDQGTANFGKQPVFYELIVQSEILALSSPLTLFITAPGAADIAARKNLVHPKTQKPYFSAIQPLHKRHADFQLYLHGLFRTPPAGGGPPLSRLCKRMYEYLSASGKLAERVDPALGLQIREMQNGPVSSETTGTPLLDASQQPVTILGVPLLKAASTMIPRLAKSPIGIKATRLKEGAHAPIVWTGATDSFGTPKTTLPPLPATLPPLSERVVPDLNAPFPYLCAADFLEERLVRLPFAMNSPQFYTPRYEDFPANYEQSFLLPLRPAFFDFFDPGSIPTMATFRHMANSDGVVFELAIPTRNQVLKFSRTYFESPQQQSKYGKIVNANMNCALFPFLTIKDLPQFSNNYWVMLVDAERERALLTRQCFDLRFKRVGETSVQPFVAQENAPLSVDRHERCDKSLDAGSTYFHLRGGPCDLIEVDSFSFDRDRHATAVLAPNWPDRPLGNRKARIAIDFGTTNSHMALRIDGEREPVPFRVAPSELQVALLNMPNMEQALESARYDTFASQILGTGIRLHHEFVPSVIGEGSVFHFPLRTATSEQKNLQLGGFKPLQTINISFAHGLDAPRSEEHIETNLKWTLDDPLMERRVSAFIEELLLLMRTKLLLNDVDPRTLVLTWFRPLSFNRYTHTRFNEIWKKEATAAFGMPEDRVTSLSESEAPYYYHLHSSMITSKPTVCIDIGGGSTDVVFFDGEEPRFGTSFSFAGNALWGSGYAQVGMQDSGLIRSLAGEVEDRMNAAADKNKFSGLQKAYTALRASGAPSQELMNFCFGVDSQIHVTEALSKNSDIKCLALIHYSAIVYYCAQLMKAKGMQPPEFLCFSGRGSQYLNILEFGKTKQSVAALSQAILEHVFGTALTVPISLRFAQDSKEATCNGGLLKDMEEQAGGAIVDSKPVPSFAAVGDIAMTPATGVNVQQVDAAVQAAVANNVRAFVDMLIGLSTNSECHFKECFGIKFQPLVVKEVLTQKLEDTVQFGLRKRYPKSKTEDEEISETLFFYPFVQNLYELGNRLLGPAN